MFQSQRDVFALLSVSYRHKSLWNYGHHFPRSLNSHLQDAENELWYCCDKCDLCYYSPFSVLSVL